LGIFIVQTSLASGPSTNMALSYQARIVDSSGVQLPDGAQNIKFVIYDALSGGNCEYTARGTCGTPTAKSVTIASGTFSTVIGGSGDVAMPTALFSGDEQRYLEISVETSTPGTYETLAPRKRLVSTAFAINTNLLDDLDTSSVGGSTAFVPVTDSSGNLTLTQNAYFGDSAASDTVVFTNSRVASSFVPSANDTYDLGATDLRWQDIYLGPDSIHIGTSATDEGTISYDTSGNILNFATDSTTNADIAFFTNDLYIDKSTSRVGIGTAAPNAPLQVAGYIDFNPTYNLTAVGSGAGNGITTGSGNVLLGYNAGTAITASAGNIAIGSGALDTMTDNGSDYTVAIGYDALTALTDGDYNTAVGGLAADIRTPFLVTTLSVLPVQVLKILPLAITFLMRLPQRVTATLELVVRFSAVLLVVTTTLVSVTLLVTLSLNPLEISPSAIVL
jgi:hypothetical protein